MRSRLLLLIVSFSLSYCSYTEKIRDGRTALARRQYHVAVPMLEKEYRKEKSESEKGKIAFSIGESMEKSGRREESVQWFKKAIEHRNGAEAIRAFAGGLKFLEQYPEAIQAYRDLGVEIGSNYEVKKDITACENAIKWKLGEGKSGFTVEKVAFNSPFDDFAPCMYSAGQLVITSDRPGPGKQQRYKWTGRPFSDFYIIDAENNSVKNFAALINASENEAAATFSADHSKMIFCRSVSEGKNDDAYMKLFSAVREGALWGSPQVISFCREMVNYWHPYLSNDGKKLYFSVNDPELTSGFDLYYSALGENGEWGEPIAFPKNINSPGDEVFPTISGDTLYFSSNYHPGMGGLDIFKTYPLRNGWANPVNLKAPINSGADDCSFVADLSAPLQKDELLKGFFCSNRKGGAGGDDIYRFVKKNIPAAKAEVSVATDRKKDIKQSQIWLEGYIVEKIFQQAEDPNSKVIGKRTLSEVYVNVSNGKEKMQVSSNQDGYFTVQLQENADYVLQVKKDGYLNKTVELSTRNMPKDADNPVQRIEVEIELEKIFKNKEIVLKNIYYDFDKSEVRDDAKPTLNELAELLRENQHIRIRLSSHTDCQGNEAYNEDLSQRRAQSAVDYLISLGISASRLQAKGFGESQPAVNCACSKCTESDNQANRRTTFTILDDDQ